MDDLDVLFLTDILPTAWHANEMGEVHEGDVVAIWGAGPGERKEAAVAGRVRSTVCCSFVLAEREGVFKPFNAPEFYCLALRNNRGGRDGRR